MSTRRRHRSVVRPPSRPPVVTVDRTLYQQSALYFGLFSLVVFWAFWPSYFSRLSDQPEVRFHTHGVAMTLWCAMLVTQAVLIRTGRRSVHRLVGKASFVLVPFVVLTTINLAHHRMQGIPRLSSLDLHFLALVLNALVAFVALYALAIRHRRQPGLHARYMVCTVFPLFTPATDRIIAAHFRPLAALVPTIDGSPILPVAGFLLADLILLALVVWDWRRARRVDAFAVALGVLLAYHVSVLTFHQVPAWRAFGEWFLRAPLS